MTMSHIRLIQHLFRGEVIVHHVIKLLHLIGGHDQPHFIFKMDAPIDQNAEESVVSFINDQFGSDLKNLGKAKQLYEQVEQSKLGIEQRVSLIVS